MNKMYNVGLKTVVAVKTTNGNVLVNYFWWNASKKEENIYLQKIEVNVHLS
jgi:hypothetical protein